MVGGRGNSAMKSKNIERLFNGEFPEKPGALLDFLKKFGTKWNISLFHYRNIGSAYGNILIGIEDPNTNKKGFNGADDIADWFKNDRSDDWRQRD